MDKKIIEAMEKRTKKSNSGDKHMRGLIESMTELEIDPEVRVSDEEIFHTVALILAIDRMRPAVRARK